MNDNAEMMLFGEDGEKRLERIAKAWSSLPDIAQLLVVTWAEGLCAMRDIDKK